MGPSTFATTTPSVSIDAGRMLAAVAAVADPELAGVGIGDLGIVERVEVVGASVQVVLIPTFLGCPALDVIRRDVESAVRAQGATDVVVRFAASPRWSPDRISADGRHQLARLGIAVRDPHGVAVCPECATTDTESAAAALSLTERHSVGSTACRSVAWCGECRTPVDIMRRPGS